MNYYHVENAGFWFVVLCATKRDARSIGVIEWGRGQVSGVRRADPPEVANYESQNGKLFPESPEE